MSYALEDLSKRTVNWRVTPQRGVGDNYLEYKGVHLWVSTNDFNIQTQRWIDAPTLEEAVLEAVRWLDDLSSARPKKRPKPVKRKS